MGIRKIYSPTGKLIGWFNEEKARKFHNYQWRERNLVEGEELNIDYRKFQILYLTASGKWILEVFGGSPDKSILCFITEEEAKEWLWDNWFYIMEEKLYFKLQKKVHRKFKREVEKRINDYDSLAWESLLCLVLRLNAFREAYEASQTDEEIFRVRGKWYENLRDWIEDYVLWLGTDDTEQFYCLRFGFEYWDDAFYYNKKTKEILYIFPDYPEQEYTILKGDDYELIKNAFEWLWNI